MSKIRLVFRCACSLHPTPKHHYYITVGASALLCPYPPAIITQNLSREEYLTCAFALHPTSSHRTPPSEHHHSPSKRERSDLKQEHSPSEQETPSSEHQTPSSEHETPSSEHQTPSLEGEVRGILQEFSYSKRGQQ